jgi:hypothetical protein
MHLSTTIFFLAGCRSIAEIHHSGKLSVLRPINFHMAHRPDDLLRGQIHHQYAGPGKHSPKWAKRRTATQPSRFMWTVGKLCGNDTIRSLTRPLPPFIKKSLNLFKPRRVNPIPGKPSSFFRVFFPGIFQKFPALKVSQP